LKSQNIQYVPALDHLRGFAALLVLFYHGVFGIYHDLTTVPPVLAYTDEMLPRADFFLSAFIYEGHSGVALFMVLSGFIFTVGTHGHGISYWQFIRNRFLRTYPLFLFMLLSGYIQTQQVLILAAYCSRYFSLPTCQEVQSEGLLQTFIGRLP